jgi:hypothetical protein
MHFSGNILQKNNGDIAFKNFSVMCVSKTVCLLYQQMICICCLEGVGLYEGKSVNKSQKAVKKILSEIFT